MEPTNQLPSTADRYQTVAIQQSLAHTRARYLGSPELRAESLVVLHPPRPAGWKTTPDTQIPTATVLWQREAPHRPWYFVSYRPSPTEGPLVPQTHFLKTAPDAFHEIWIGTKNFECRFNDRGYQEGDTLVLREFTQGGTLHQYDARQDDGDSELEVPAEFSGRQLRARVTHVLTAKNLAAMGAGAGLAPGWVVLALELE